VRSGLVADMGSPCICWRGPKALCLAIARAGDDGGAAEAARRTVDRNRLPSQALETRGVNVFLVDDGRLLRTGSLVDGSRLQGNQRNTLLLGVGLELLGAGPCS
jgi:hypothetical protein